MSMRFYFILMLAVGQLIFGGCYKQPPPDLKSISPKIKVMTVYDVEPASNYSEDDLKRASNVQFDVKLFQHFASEAKYKPGEPLYKGGSLAVIELTDGTKVQLALSCYGGFFMILGTDGLFYFENDALIKWKEAFFQRIIEEDFIPKRIERNKNLKQYHKGVIH